MTYIGNDIRMNVQTAVFRAAVVILAVILFVNARKLWYRDNYQWAFPPLERKEGFQIVPAPQWVPGATPVPLNLDYESYDLLKGVLKGFPERRIAEGPTAQTCFDRDFGRSIERAGSYAQRTNNYKRGYPDSCSAPNHDLVLDFYVPKAVGWPQQI